MTVLVLASQLNEMAQRAVARWPGQRAILLTPSDLSIEGWYVCHHDFEQSTLVATGKLFPVDKISGVVTLMPFVAEYELFSIEPPNRRYAAAEMMAFLFYVLTSLRCPVVNTPTAYNLTGPNWRYEEWLRACREVGLPVKPYHRLPVGESLMPQNMYRTKTVSVLGNRVIARDFDVSSAAVKQLAAAANVQFLEVRFTEENGQNSVSSVNCIPDLSDPVVFDALYDHFKNAT